MNTLIHPINNVEKLSTELKNLRRHKKITQQQLAERCLLSRRTITNAESAHNVGLVEFTRMANALGYELVLRPQKTVVFEELADIFLEDD
ncbi:helix-turn-helix transcriptional regulator [Moraxellaceae bacterium AER2_44_116]|nr:helix-turn-helix transcriptional regulator [Moraxellaceae bacterium AER2_44_116]